MSNILKPLGLVALLTAATLYNIKPKDDSQNPEDNSSIVTTEQAVEPPKRLSYAEEEALKIVPYICPADDGMTLFEEWKKSKNRASSVDNGGSAARVERGKTYAAFMDSLYQAIDKNVAEKIPETMGDMMNIIQQAYIEAYDSAGGAVLEKKVTPILAFDSFSRGPKTDGFDHDFLPKDLKSMDLKSNPQIKAMLQKPEASYDTGIEISIRFQADWGDYMYMSIADGVARYQDATMDSPLSAFLGDVKTDDNRHSPARMRANLQDDVACNLNP